MPNGPLPSTLVLLSDLPSTAPGTKVRFLGCVCSYSPTTGLLALQHTRTTSTSSTPVEPTVAQVDLGLLLESLKSTDTAVGEWVNVIGYVGRHGNAQRHKAFGHTGSVGKQSRAREENRGVAKVYVQAIMLWSAGAVGIDQYEKAMEGRKAIR